MDSLNTLLKLTLIESYIPFKVTHILITFLSQQADQTGSILLWNSKRKS